MSKLSNIIYYFFLFVVFFCGLLFFFNYYDVVHIVFEKSIETGKTTFLISFKFDKFWDDFYKFLDYLVLNIYLIELEYDIDIIKVINHFIVFFNFLFKIFYVILYIFSSPLWPFLKIFVVSKVYFFFLIVLCLLLLCFFFSLFFLIKYFFDQMFIFYLFIVFLHFLYFFDFISFVSFFIFIYFIFLFFFLEGFYFFFKKNKKYIYFKFLVSLFFFHIYFYLILILFLYVFFDYFLIEFALDQESLIHFPDVYTHSDESDCDYLYEDPETRKVVKKIVNLNALDFVIDFRLNFSFFTLKYHIYYIKFFIFLFLDWFSF